MVPDWKTNRVYFSDILPGRYLRLWQQLTQALSKHGIPWNLLGDTRDVWARDYCPVQVGPSRFIKFRYNPDYLREQYKNQITGDRVCRQLGSLGNIRRSRIILDGGNIVGSERTIILTDKILKENPGKDQANLQARLRTLLKVPKCLLIPGETGDVIGHADGLVRFVDEETVVMNDYTGVDPKYGARLRGILEDQGFRVELLPYFYEPFRKDGIPSAVGNYVNLLRIGNLILLPSYGVVQDRLAAKKLRPLCPQAIVRSIGCRELARDGGVLNCVAWSVCGQPTGELFEEGEPDDA